MRLPSPRWLPAAAACVAALALAGPAGAALPGSMAGIGDSLTRAWGVNGGPGDVPEASWSTGTLSGLQSHYQRLLALNPAIAGKAWNDAQSGSPMSDTLRQANLAVTQGAQYVTIWSGTNDVCRPTLAQMTSVADFTTALRATLSRLTTGLPGVTVLVVSVPDWVAHWQRLAGNPSAQAAWAANATCPTIFGASATDADRAVAAQRIADFNAAIASSCALYAGCTTDGGAVYRLRPDVSQLAFDYFHLGAGGEALVAETTWSAGPYAGSTGGGSGGGGSGGSLPAGFTTVTTDSGCTGCTVTPVTDGLRATIQGGQNHLDTAYATHDTGTNGLTGRTYTRTLITLAAGQTLTANLAVVQVRDTTGKLVYELYIAPDRTLRLWSPAGGLRATSINQSTGQTVPNDGTTTLRAEVSAQANASITVRTNGTDTITLTNLTGATTTNQRTLHAGIDHYDTNGTTDTATTTHTHLAITTTDWPGTP